MTGDILDYIRARLAARRPDVLPTVEPVLAEARRAFGGNTVYVRMKALAENVEKPAKTPPT